jgi:hypothetical protein
MKIRQERASSASAQGCSPKRNFRVVRQNEAAGAADAAAW